MGVHVFYKVYSDYLFARSLNSRDNQLANISENQVLANISGSPVVKVKILLPWLGHPIASSLESNRLSLLLTSYIHVVDLKYVLD